MIMPQNDQASTLILRATELGASSQNFLCSYSLLDGSITGCAGADAASGGLIEQHRLHKGTALSGGSSEGEGPGWRITGIDCSSRANRVGDSTEGEERHRYNFVDFMPLGGVGLELDNPEFL